MLRCLKRYIKNNSIKYDNLFEKDILKIIQLDMIIY